MRIMLEIAGDQNDLAGGVLQIEDILKAGGVEDHGDAVAEPGAALP